MHYHIIGIAGAGMSAIANLLLDQGHTVSGSDPASNPQTAALAARGVTIYHRHRAASVAGADAVLATAAVPDQHIELVAAQQAGIPRLRREDLWYAWARQRLTIGVAGTHGKTTTTAMIAWALERAGRNPGFLIGSAAANLGTNARWGNPLAPLVLEADEYNRAFLSLPAHIAVVTNVEWDHPDVYPTAADYRAAFATYALEAEGVIVACGDASAGYQPGEGWHTAARDIGLPFVTYGLEAGNTYQAVPVADEPDRPDDSGILSAFRVRHPKGIPDIVHISEGASALEQTYRLAVPGTHNILNALAALVVCDMFSIQRSVTAAALREFRGTARRFEWQGSASGVTVIDDYAHHPTEVRATLAAARAAYRSRRVLAYIQPHTYSRTRTLLAAWGSAFADADLVLVGAVYASREQADAASQQAVQQALIDQIAAHHPAVHYVGGVAEASASIPALLHAGDVLLTMGAGDGNQIGPAVLRQLRQHNGEQ